MLGLLIMEEMNDEVTATRQRASDTKRCAANHEKRISLSWRNSQSTAHPLKCSQSEEGVLVGDCDSSWGKVRQWSQRQSAHQRKQRA